MTDGSFPDRLSQLKTRWESDPSSRIFLQLAEEYRHQGRVKEALAVLDKGLQEHPGYLSALVAKGRCHLELNEGEAARGVLERVVKQDATQMVANKLLVRAYLETGEPSRARERLDLYSLLNDSDPEIADLRRQIKAMDRPKDQSQDSPFDLGPAPAPSAASMAGDDDIFDVGPAPAAPAPRPVAAAAADPGEDIFGLGPPPVKPPAASAADEPFGDLLFPHMAAPVNRQSYLESLGSEGIFDLGTVAPTVPAASDAPTASPAEDAADISWLEEAPAPAAVPPPPVFDPATPEAVGAALNVEPSREPAAELQPEPGFEPEAEATPAVATVTLGELYLRQGHLDEADRIFREVLEREPDNAAARAGLGVVEDSRCTLASPAAASVSAIEPEPVSEPIAEPAFEASSEPVQEVSPPRPEPAPVAQPPAWLGARDLLAGFNPATRGGGITARKIHLLTHYLDRIRGGRRADVS